MEDISITDGTHIYPVEKLTFSGGEEHVLVRNLPNALYGNITVEARLQSAASILRLILLNELLERVHSNGSRKLLLPYFPYARQDRITQTNAAFTLKRVAELINSLNYQKVIIFDPHSDVAAALIHNVTIIEQLDLIEQFNSVVKIIADPLTVLVAPDLGAVKKTIKVAEHYGKQLSVANKKRDMKTGAITGLELVSGPSLKGKNCLILDDICDGGRTFTELSSVLHRAGAEEVYLYVTHGIFSKGTDIFKTGDSRIDKIFTTDSFEPRLPVDVITEPLVWKYR